MTPNTIVQYWNTSKLPDDISTLVDTWKVHNPSMKHKLFSYEDASAFISQHYDSEIQELFKIAALPAMQSDIFRVAYCLKVGGLYVDCGIKCKAPVAPLLSSEALFLVRKWHGGIMNGAIGCRAGHPALEWIWNRIVQNLKERNSNDVWRLTGPLSFNQMVESGEFESSLNVVEQASTKPYFDIVNELEHKKKHWSKEQEKQSVFSDELDDKKASTPHQISSANSSAEVNSEAKTKLVAIKDDLEASSCEVVISGGFEKEHVSRVIINVSNIVLSSGTVNRFPIILNKRGNRTEVEFYAPKPHRHFPLRQFVTSGNNGVTDYMLLMVEQTESNAFYKLSATDQADLITILMQLHIAFSKQRFVFDNNVSESNVGDIETWCQAIEALITSLTEAKTKETSSKPVSTISKITVKKLALVASNNAVDNELALCGQAIIEGGSQPEAFNVRISADSTVSKVLSVSVDNLNLKPRKAELVHAISNTLHKTNCNGITLGYALERWYYALQSFVK
jgi:hypothetical protein